MRLTSTLASDATARTISNTSEGGVCAGLSKLHATS